MANTEAVCSGNDESIDEEVVDSGKFGSSMDEEAAEKMDSKDESIYCFKRISGRTIDFGGS
jgi:hypothetical protein